MILFTTRKKAWNVSSKSLFKDREDQTQLKPKLLEMLELLERKDLISRNLFSLMTLLMSWKRFHDRNNERTNERTKRKEMKWKKRKKRSETRLVGMKWDYNRNCLLLLVWRRSWTTFFFLGQEKSIKIEWDEDRQRIRRTLRWELKLWRLAQEDMKMSCF
jgi:hypothetical protein